MDEIERETNELENLYQDYWFIHSEKMNDHSPLEIAAVLLAQAMSIYKTCLTAEEYEKMIDNISDLRHNVKELTPDQENYH